MVAAVASSSAVPTAGRRIVVAISGGVDSSVAGYLLQKTYPTPDIVGLHVSSMIAYSYSITLEAAGDTYRSLHSAFFHLCLHSFLMAFFLRHTVNYSSLLTDEQLGRIR